MKYLKIFAQILLVGLIFYFLLGNLFSNWNDLIASRPRFSPFYGLLAFLAVMCAWLLSAWSWGRVLDAFGFRIPYDDVFIIYFKANLGKYLPGKIWQIVGSAYFAAGKGIPEGVAITTSLIGQAYSVLSGISLFAAALVFGWVKLGHDVDLLFKWTALPILVLLLVIAFRPDFGQPFLNRLLRLFRRQEVVIKLSILRAAELFLLYLICWFLFGLGLWLFSNALTPAKIGLYIPLTAILAAAVAIGFLALFAPGGLGVREGVIALFLASIPAFPTPLPSAIAVGYRIIMTIAEIIAFGLTWVIKWI